MEDTTTKNLQLLKNKIFGARIRHSFCPATTHAAIPRAAIPYPPHPPTPPTQWQAMEGITASYCKAYKMKPMICHQRSPCN